MKITRFTAGAWDQNAYLIEKEGKNFIIDPGWNGEKLIPHIKKNNIHLDAILLTHGHFDHIGCTVQITEEFGDVPVYLNKEDHFIAKTGGLLADYGFGKQPDITQLDYWFGRSLNIESLINTKPFDSLEFINIDKWTKKIMGVSIKVIEAPGHSKGSVIFGFGNDYFTGDFLFKEGYGRMDIPECNLQVLKKQFKKVFKSIPGTAHMLPGHGPDESFENIKLNNKEFNKLLNEG